MKSLAAIVGCALAGAVSAAALVGQPAPAFTVTDLAGKPVNSTHRGASDYTEPAKLTSQLKDFGAAPAGYLMDEPGRMGMVYGAKVTPHMYIIDGGGKVVYNGAIDDNRSANVEDVKTAKNYVVAALDELKAGKPVSTPSTNPYGCTVKYK